MQRHRLAWLVAGTLVGLGALQLSRGLTHPAASRFQPGLERPASAAKLAHAAPQATPWSVTLAPQADTWAWRFVVVTPPAPATIHGAEAVLVTGIDDTRGTQVAFLRFNVSQIPRLPNWLMSATLRLTVASESPGSSRPHRSNIHRVEEAWEEASLADGQVPNIGASLSERTDAVGGVMEWDVTELVRGWVGGAANHGLAVTTADDRIYTRTFHSREAAAGQPELLVWLMPQMTFPPPPTADLTTTPPTLPWTSTPTLTPTSTATATPTPTQTTAGLPDLVGFAYQGCTTSAIAVTMRNRGDADAGPFSVSSTAGPLPAWRVSGLLAGATLQLPPQPGSTAPLMIDPANEVIESDESNNLVPVAVPGCQLWFIPHAMRGR